MQLQEMPGMGEEFKQVAPNPASPPPPLIWPNLAFTTQKQHVQGKAEAGLELRHCSWCKCFCPGCLGAAGLGAEAGRSGRSFSRLTPPRILLLGALVSAHGFPFPLWTKLQAGSCGSHGLSAVSCQLEGRCSKAMEWEYGKDAEQTATFARWGFLSA